jgi:hypothetical protein
MKPQSTKPAHKMVKETKAILISLLILLAYSSSILPALTATQSTTQSIHLQGSIAQSPQFGVWDIGRSDYLENPNKELQTDIPSTTSWAIVDSPDYGNANLFENPGFEQDLLNWQLCTPNSLSVDIRNGYCSKSAVLINSELNYGEGIMQSFINVPPNTTFDFKALIKSLDMGGLEWIALYYDICDGQGNIISGDLKPLNGSTEWTLYETSFTTPNTITEVHLFPALVYNLGEIWIDNTYVGIKDWIAPSKVPIILNWMKDYYPVKPFIYERDLKQVEERLKTISIENFWGILFIHEEIYRTHIAFADNLNCTWFGEQMMGYPIYLQIVSNATKDEWKSEMYLRMVRGFYDYFSPLTKVGITAGDAIIPELIEEYYGKPAVAFIQQHYDFIIAYTYIPNLGSYNQFGKSYLSAVDQLFSNMTRFWILTRMWDHNAEEWEVEAIALEMKYCLDKQMIITTYYRSNPSLEQIWPLMNRAVELYNNHVPYFETYVYGRNLLTGYVGVTYGWVEVLN